MEKAIVLGIEGGGTKTEWVLLKDGAVQSSGSLPPGNMRLLSDADLRELFSVLPRGPGRVGAFLAGCATELDRARLRRLVEDVWPEASVTVGSDRDSAMAVALGPADGIVVIAGTGSAVTGRKGDRFEKAGGWGQLLGDRGGGYNLAMEALRSVLENYDLDHRVMPLAESILCALGLNRLDELVSWASDADKMSVARLAPVVFEAAQRGDEEMISVVQGGAKVLAQFTCAVASRLGVRSVPVKLTGGLFVHHPVYVDLFRDYVSDMLPGVAVELCDRSGAFGAAWLAARELPFPETRKPDSENADLRELAHALTEQRNPRSNNLDRLSTPQLVQLFIDEEAHVTAALEAVKDRLSAAIDLTSAQLRDGGRLFYAGAGTSGRLGVLDASEIPPTFSAPPDLVQGIIAGGARALMQAVEGAEDSAEQGRHAMFERGIGARDVLCGIAASGRTPFVLGALQAARDRGARTIFLTCNPARNPSPTPWDVEIDLPTGPEIITGSTRLKAGTATKLVLNMLSTCAMIRLGKVRGNLMIALNISNAKLRDRAIRLVGAARGCSYEQARALLETNEWNIAACVADETDKS
jgi:N-acetylmuramic acid 6-phosphate etherase